MPKRSGKSTSKAGSQTRDNSDSEWNPSSPLGVNDDEREDSQSAQSTFASNRKSARTDQDIAETFNMDEFDLQPSR